MDTTPAGQVVMTPSASLSISPPGADPASTAGALASLSVADSTDITISARPVIREGGGIYSLSLTLREQSWTQSWNLHFSIGPFISGTSTTPTSAASGDGDAHAQGPLFTFVLALLAYGAGVIAGVLADSKDTVSRWRTVPKVVYGVTAVLAIASLAVGFMAVGWHAALLVAGNSGNLMVSAFCAKLGAILSSSLLAVAFCCKLGRWGCATGVPCAAVIAVLMAVLWIWGDERAAARAVRNCWHRIKDRLCRLRLSQTPSTRDLEVANGREEGDGVELPGREGEDGMELPGREGGDGMV